jgi:hypothetical protein
MSKAMDVFTNLYRQYPLFNHFISLSYPTNPPKNLDSFPNANYYGTGPLDACFVVAWVAVLAVLREFFRLVVLEPFARWWLGRLAEKEKRRGAETPKKVAANPIPTQLEKEGVRSRRKEQVKLEKITRKRKPGMTKEEWRRERSVLRFAEQGWAFLYYTVYWSLGLVSPVMLRCSLSLIFPSSVYPPLSSPLSFQTCSPLAGLPTPPDRGSYQVLLPLPIRLLVSPGPHSQRRSASQGPLANDVPSRYHTCAHGRFLLHQFHSCWVSYPVPHGLVRYLAAICQNA